MILRVSSNFSDKLGFKSKKEESKGYPPEGALLENKFSIRSRIALDKFTKAFTIYPAKGITGSKKANFYEFLTMGTVPYVVGSITLMSVFNSASKHYKEFAQSKAAKLGNKMALGVILYCVAKDLSKALINYPVKKITGIDTELPYAKPDCLAQEHKRDFNLNSIEYHKVGESVDFPYWLMLYGDPKKGESRNFRFDKIAKKNGLGENLNDSDQEVKPMYKEVLVKSKFAKSMSSYLWAATGVALAFQKPMEKYLNIATLKFWDTKNFGHSIKTLGTSFIESAKSLWKGSENSASAIQRHSGKALVGIAAISTILGVLNTINITQKPQKEAKVIKENKESVVN